MFKINNTELRLSLDLIRIIHKIGKGLTFSCVSQIYRAEYLRATRNLSPFILWGILHESSDSQTSNVH